MGAYHFTSAVHVFLVIQFDKIGVTIISTNGLLLVRNMWQCTIRILEKEIEIVRVLASNVVFISVFTTESDLAIEAVIRLLHPGSWV